MTPIEISSGFSESQFYDVIASLSCEGYGEIRYCLYGRKLSYLNHAELCWCCQDRTIENPCKILGFKTDSTSWVKKGC